MKRIRLWWIAAAAGVAVAAFAGIAVVSGQETPVPGADAGQTMLDRVAEKLGIDSPTLRDAIESSASDEIDERLAAGELTQEQADALKERLAEAPDDSLIGGGRHGPGHGPGGHEFFFGGDELATFLGITVEELRMELQADGATLPTVAEAHGKSRDELKAFLTEQFSAKVAERVASGDLTQEEADARLAEKTANLDTIIDGTGPFGHGFRGGPGGPFPGMTPDEVPAGETPDGATPESTPSTTPSSSPTSTT